MSILKRFADIMSSNINALLDKMEDPAKMIDQTMRELQDSLGEVKSETAGVMADEQRARRQLDALNADAEKMRAYAEKAVLAGNDEDAKLFLGKKSDLESRRQGLQAAYDAAAENSEKMRLMHDKLVEQIRDLESRRETIKAKLAVAKTQERINKIGSSAGAAADSVGAFERLEEKANRKLDEANAMARLNTDAAAQKLDDVMAKYDSAPACDVEDELAALKAKLGK